jgi:patatin-like phospholipase/acyl hydrolase
MAFKAAVLSIDGGGIKGIVPAMILAEIEKRTNKRIYELFDLIAGTSTGGILSLGLTKPNSDGIGAQFKAEKLVELYEKEGTKIFKKNESQKIPYWQLQALRLIFNKFKIQVNPEELFSSKYTREEKIQVIEKWLGKKTPISEALTEVLITSYATNIRMPFLFTSNPNQENLTSKNFRQVCSGCTMYDAAMATSAAPTFFKAYSKKFMDRNKGGEYILVDGGVIANNPTSIAIVEAMKSYNAQISLPEILVVSLGTGTAIRQFSEEINEWGMIKWVEPLINIVFSGQSEVIDYQMEHLLLKEQYYRFQLDYKNSRLVKRREPSESPYVVTEEINVKDEMDDASEENIKNLKKAAQKFIEEVDSDLNKLCGSLTEALSTRKVLKKIY